MGPETYLDHLRAESALFRAALAGCDPAARVPACPDWDAADLLWHLGTVQRHWAWVVEHRPASPDGRPEVARPGSYEALLEAFDTSSAALLTALEQADPSETAWSWAPEQTVGFTYRRQAHEALVHRVDAEQTAGLPVTPPDPALAADGVREALDVMYGGKPPWGAFTPGADLVEVRLTDAGSSVLVRMGTFDGTSPAGDVLADEPDLLVVRGGTPTATISGTAADVDLWIWNRGPLDRLRTAGDVSPLLPILGQPLN